MSVSHHMRSHRTAIVAALLLCAVNFSAKGASFDCRRAANTMERTICSDPKLSAMDDRLARQFAAAIALSPDPASVRDEQLEWLNRIRSKQACCVPKGTSERDRLATFYSVRLSDYDRQIAQLKSIKRYFTEKDVRAICPAQPDDTTGEQCKVTGFGNLAPVDRHSFAWSQFTYSLNGELMGSGVAVFERIAGGLKLLILPDDDGAFFDPPGILASAGLIVLHIPGHESGTGNFNRERLFVWRNGGWHDVNTTAWLKSLQQRLPKGLEARKGIYPDYAKMAAQTELWRKGDSETCGTGGEADLSLGWSGDRLVLEAVRLHRDKSEC